MSDASTRLQNHDRVRELETRIAGMLDALYRDTGIRVTSLQIKRMRQAGGSGPDYHEVRAQIYP